MWDTICDAIERRESALAQLEAFEKKASDPSRFFAHGMHNKISVLMYAFSRAISRSLKDAHEFFLSCTYDGELRTFIALVQVMWDLPQ